MVHNAVAQRQLAVSLIFRFLSDQHHISALCSSGGKGLALDDPSVTKNYANPQRIGIDSGTAVDCDCHGLTDR